MPAPRPAGLAEEEGRSIPGEAVSGGSWGRGEAWRRGGDGVSPACASFAQLVFNIHSMSHARLG